MMDYNQQFGKCVVTNHSIKIRETESSSAKGHYDTLDHRPADLLHFRPSIHRPRVSVSGGKAN